ncbi:MAG: hypothetical protein AAFN79_17850 [Pseudomonadota bacterium]
MSLILFIAISEIVNQRAERLFDLRQQLWLAAKDLRWDRKG